MFRLRLFLLIVAAVGYVALNRNESVYDEHQHRVLKSLEMIHQQKKYRNNRHHHGGGSGRGGGGTIQRRKQNRLREVLPDDMDAWAFMKVRNTSLDGSLSSYKRKRQRQQQKSSQQEKGQINDMSTPSTKLSTHTIDPAIFPTIFTQKEIHNAKKEGIDITMDIAKKRCEGRFSKRRFYNENEQRNPPILYTFPGDICPGVRV